MACSCSESNQHKNHSFDPKHVKPDCICNERFNPNLKQDMQKRCPEEPPPRSDESSMFGLCCKCPPPPPVVQPDPPPRCCPYLVCPCPEPCIIKDKEECEDKPKCCCHLDCQKTPTGFDVTCKTCNKNCPVEIYCPVPKSCLPRCTVNCPQRYPHHRE